jgi:hypothetical protein
MIQFIYADGSTVWGKAKPGIPVSYVAGIYGEKGMRVVVTRRAIDFKRYHVGPGEKCLIVPDLRVEEPVAWNALPFVIQHTFDCVNKHVAAKNHCGECRACCTTLYIATDKFTKPSHQPCTHLGERGCKIYAARPRECQGFECLWLKSQRGNDPMSPDLRPDQCGVIFTPSSNDPADLALFEVHPMRGREMTAKARAWIDAEQARGGKAYLVTHYHGEKP